MMNAKKIYYALLITLPMYSVAIPASDWIDNIPNLLTYVILIYSIFSMFFLGHLKTIRNKITFQYIVCLSTTIYFAIRPIFTSYSILELKQNMTCIIFFVLPLLVIHKKEDMLNAFKCIALGCIINAIVIYLMAFGFFNAFFESITVSKISYSVYRDFVIDIYKNNPSCGFFVTHGDFGIYMSYAICFLVLFGFLGKKIIHLALGFFLLIAVFLSPSRSSWGAILIVIFLSFLYIWNINYKNKYLLLSLKIFSIILIAMTFFPIFNYVLNLQTSSFVRRFIIAEIALSDYQISLFGLGKYIYIFLDGYESAIHNQFLMTLITYGIVGFVGFSYIIVYILRYFYRKGLKDWFGEIFFIGLVGTCFEMAFYSNVSSKFIWTTLGLASNYIIIREGMCAKRTKLVTIQQSPQKLYTYPL